jgi:hypothetical protein
MRKRREARSARDAERLRHLRAAIRVLDDSENSMLDRL